MALMACRVFAIDVGAPHSLLQGGFSILKVRPGWPRHPIAARSSRQSRRFPHLINADKVFRTHSQTRTSSDRSESALGPANLLRPTIDATANEGHTTSAGGVSPARCLMRET